MALTAYADSRHLTCYPSVGTLARDSGFSTRTVQRALRRLESAGAITTRPPIRAVGRKGPMSFVYTLKIAPNSGCQRVTHGVSESHGGGVRESPKQVIEQNIEKKRSEPPNPPTSSLIPKTPKPAVDSDSDSTPFKSGTEAPGSARAVGQSESKPLPEPPTDDAPLPEVTAESRTVVSPDSNSAAGTAVPELPFQDWADTPEERAREVAEIYQALGRKHPYRRGG